GDEWLSGGHHLEVSHVSDAARALGWLEGAIEDGEVIVLDVWRPFDGAGGIDVADDGVGLLMVVAELEQGRRNGVVYDLDHPAANQLLVLHEREIGLDAGGVAIHEEADRTGGRENGDLRVAVTKLLAVSQSFVPASFGSLVERSGNVGLVDVIHRSPVHADYVEERLAIDVEAGASAARHDGRGARRSNRISKIRVRQALFRG